jgi:hypothetical protein
MHNDSPPGPSTTILGNFGAVEPQNTAADDPDTIEIAGKRYLTNRGLAKELKKSERTIARWDALRIGPPKIKVGRLVLYDPDQIPEWLAQHVEERPIRRSRRRTREG